MGRRTLFLLPLLAVLALTACGEAGSERDDVTGPQFKPAPPEPCDFSGLSGLIRGYFPGPRQNAIVGLKDAMAGEGKHTPGARDYGFRIMDSIGYLSRDPSVDSDPAAGAMLTVGLIECMFNKADTISYPTTALADFTQALTRDDGGAYYVRGVGAGSNSTVLGTDWSAPADPTNLSGLRPVDGSTWSSVLAGNGASEGRALIYGYLVTPDPVEYEWSTVPSASTFNPGVVVSVCDGSADDKAAMVLESGIGVLAFVEDDICDDPQTLAMHRGGSGPRQLAGRLARVLFDALSPAPLQATAVVAFRSGSGGTATTFKSRFKTKGVSTVGFTFTEAPKTILTSKQPVTVIVRATTTIEGKTEGVNGVCVYLTGANNNGQGTSLVGTVECDDTPPDGLSTQTRSLNGLAGYAVFTLSVTKTGGLILTASSEDADGTTGAVGRDGQTFAPATFKTNVKP